MLCKKGMCFFLFVTSALMVTPALGPRQAQSLDRIRADGGAPPAPPIPWPSGARAIDAPQLNADGGAPPSPPIPWPSTTSEHSTLRADGGAPPAPPIPWGFANIGMESQAV